MACWIFWNRIAVGGERGRDWPIPLIATVLAVANVVVAAGFFTHLAHITCISLLIYLILVSVLYFASLLIPNEGH